MIYGVQIYYNKFKRHPLQGEPLQQTAITMPVESRRQFPREAERDIRSDWDTDPCAITWYTDRRRQFPRKAERDIRSDGDTEPYTIIWYTQRRMKSPGNQAAGCVTRN